MRKRRGRGKGRRADWRRPKPELFKGAIKELKKKQQQEKQGKLLPSIVLAMASKHGLVNSMFDS